MKIGLVDVDNNTGKRNTIAKYPNIALCKISRYHKNKGDTVEWANHFDHYDIVYMSKVFNFSPDDLTFYDADEIIKGGTGYDIESVLPHEIDRLQPDYNLYPEIPNDTAYGFLTRGCPNKCNWCVVPKKEGIIREYMDVDEIAIEGRRKLILMDNNILASGNYAIKQFEKIIERGYCVDFNQAIDARLVTDDFARLLAKIKWIQRRIRFGCDTMAQIKHCERAIEKINSYGYKGEYFLYTMIGGNNGFIECYNRIHYWWERNQQCKESHQPNIYPYAQPYRNPNMINTIPQWQKDMAHWCNKHQIFHVVDFMNFEPRKGFKCIWYLNNQDKL